MKFLDLFLVLVLFTIVSTASTSENEDKLCEIERLYIIRQHEKCIPDGYSLVNIIEQIQNVAVAQLSRYLGQQYVTEFCGKTENATTCYNDISMPDRCKNSPAVINEINTLKFVETALKFMCENEGSRFIDMLNDDGPECYATNVAHTVCVENEMDKLSLDSQLFGNVFIEHNTCRFIQAAKYCLHTYSSCVNREVEYHMTELNNVLNKEYKC